MYEQFYGLRERPFDLTSDLRYLFLTPKHQEALTNLEYGISRRKGVTLVLGPAGTGKTTLIRAALARLRDRSAQCVYLNNPTLLRDEFVQTLARGLQLSEDAARSKATLLAELERRLLDRLDAGIVTALIVDEAQSLSDELLEEVRLLVNLETETEKLLPVVLVGQEELADRLSQPSSAALKQRIALRCHLPPLTQIETAQYIATRLRTAGGQPGHAFTRDAIDVIYQRSGGVPRTISVICDNALMSGFALDQRPVGKQLVLEVCRDFDFDAPPATEAVEPMLQSEALALPVAADAREIRERAAQPHAAVTAEADEAPPENARLFATFGRPMRSWFSR
jgi:general secretion pathway protein A